MILVSSLYPFGPNRFQALHGASIRHSLKVLAVQVKGLGASSAKQGTVAPSNNTHAVNTVECRVITASQFSSFQKITNVGPSNGIATDADAQTEVGGHHLAQETDLTKNRHRYIAFVKNIVWTTSAYGLSVSDT
jgi:hypothetical protein